MIHKRKPNRMKGFDYSKDNLYFVTICVHDRVCCFGNIVGTGRDPSENDNNNEHQIVTGRNPSVRKQMKLNEYGKIAEKQWYWLSDQYPYIVLHAFVVMPNHIHGIVEINRSVVTAAVGTGRDLSDIKNPDLSENENDISMETGRDLSLPIKIKSLSELMGAYKTTVSKQIHLLGYNDFVWQRSFHDHIILDNQSYNNISDYITTNPLKWDSDKFFNPKS